MSKPNERPDPFIHAKETGIIHPNVLTNPLAHKTIPSINVIRLTVHVNSPIISRIPQSRTILDNRPERLFIATPIKVIPRNTRKGTVHRTFPMREMWPYIKLRSFFEWKNS